MMLHHLQYLRIIHAVKPFDDSRGYAIRACYTSCTVCYASRGGLEKVCIKVGIGERLKIWLKRTAVESKTLLEAKDTKKTEA